VSKLKPFQRDGVRQIRKFNGRALLADEQGLGKTIQALYYLRWKDQWPAIIVTPASLKYTWQAEAMLHFNMHAEVLEGRRTARRLPGKLVILNYDILADWLPVLLKERPRVVVFDEAHFLKNVGALRTKAAMKLAANIRRVLALSGTPMTNRPIELWPILQLIKPDLFPSRVKYAWRFCAPRHTPWGWKYDGSSKLPKLHRILRKHCMIRRLKKDVLPELPAKQRRAVSFKLPPASHREYHKARKDFINWLKKNHGLARAKRAKKSEALSKVGYLIRLTARLKLAQTLRWIADFFEAHPGEKLVVLTMHTFVIDAVKERFGKRCVVINGEVTGAMREAAKRKFQTSPRVDLLAGNWKAAGVGLTLTAARSVAALDFPWTPGDLVQGEDRIHRIGQKHDVTAYYLAALGTIEESQLTMLQRKNKILEAVLDGRRTRDFDVFAALLKQFTQE